MVKLNKNKYLPNYLLILQKYIDNIDCDKKKVQNI